MAWQREVVGWRGGGFQVRGGKKHIQDLELHEPGEVIWVSCRRGDQAAIWVGMSLINL